MELHQNDPTVLWRMTRGRSTAHATIFPGPLTTTVTWYFDGVMDRAENYDTEELAMATGRGHRGNPDEGWVEREPSRSLFRVLSARFVF